MIIKLIQIILKADSHHCDNLTIARYLLYPKRSGNLINLINHKNLKL